MQPEKKFLVEEVGQYLEKSDYVYLADFERVTVAETEELRRILAEVGAEFHVVKNRILKIAASDREMPIEEENYRGPTALVVGGENAAGVAKALEKFFKDKKKLEIKGGVLDNNPLSASQISDLAKLPSKEILQAQLLGLLNQPASQMVRIIQAVPQGLLNVLHAKSEQDG
ncbi:50S ribosomal protein L10 [Puniceicoccales bacterium CK1056]|uniref:Large ribosomal subunit protein uL10 n=1 Tax=Oceanipulchritudo coccoides TaxID=2706888 RepID=A0A6B2M478_9BACT|nr:50S ribosomal protein L10 [Oceanipulchritudo coccoides]NDV62635.1 50S ribosomal protein L10 [Oceanipulchritudo coccoides]